MWQRFRKHRLGMAGLICFIIVLAFVVFPEFTAPYGRNEITRFKNAPPQLPHFFDEEGNFHIIPFFYGRESEFDLDTGKTTWSIDKSEKYPLRFLVKGSSYNFFFIKSNIHLFGTKEGQMFLLGTDKLGRDLLSRILYGGRISLTVAALTALISLGAGTIVGLISGFYGGIVDMFSQRIVELFIIIPSIPLGLALAAFLPPDLPPAIVIFGLALVLSVVRWAYVTRQVRGKALSIRESEFVMAARSIGASTPRILFKHVLPPIYAHLIVLATLTIPQAMLAEAGLSFLGFGIRPPMTSWGLLLRRARQAQIIEIYPWTMLPGAAIMITVLALNFIGDGLRDASDPYTKQLE